MSITNRNVGGEWQPDIAGTARANTLAEVSEAIRDCVRVAGPCYGTDLRRAFLHLARHIDQRKGEGPSPLGNAVRRGLEK